MLRWQIYWNCLTDSQLSRSVARRNFRLLIFSNFDVHCSVMINPELITQNRHVWTIQRSFIDLRLFLTILRLLLHFYFHSFFYPVMYLFSIPLWEHIAIYCVNLDCDWFIVWVFVPTINFGDWMALAKRACRKTTKLFDTAVIARICAVRSTV